MKNHIRTILFFLLLVVSGLASSCQEETVLPADHDVKAPRDAASGLAA